MSHVFFNVIVGFVLLMGNVSDGFVSPVASISPVPTPVVSSLADGGDIYVPLVVDGGEDFDLFEFVLGFFNTPQVKFIMYHVVFNFCVAVLVSIYEKTFTIERLWDVFGKKLLPLLGTYLTFDIVSGVLGGDLIPIGVFLAIEAALLADLLNNLDKIPTLKPLLKHVPGFLKKIVDLPTVEFVEDVGHKDL